MGHPSALPLSLHLRAKSRDVGFDARWLTDSAFLVRGILDLATIASVNSSRPRLYFYQFSGPHNTCYGFSSGRAFDAAIPN
jgi:hypothetical protein